MPKGVYKRIREHKRKLSEAGKLRIFSKECREKMSLSHRGKKFRHTEKTKRKISESLIKYYLLNPSRSKGGKGNHYWSGRKMSLELRKKISEAHKGQNAGSKHPNWKGGITAKNDALRRRIEFKIWRDAVFERDDYTCQKYKIKAVKGFGKRLRIHPHHIQNFADYPELRFEVSNGITLSENAHKEFHRKYGQTKNNRDQLMEFLAA